MAGIVKSTRKRLVVNKQVREIETPTAVLDTALFFSDAVALGASVHQPTFTSELNRLPLIAKNEAVLALVNYSINVGIVHAFNGDTKSVEILSFERASSATSFRADGLMVTNLPNIPRVYSDPNVMQLKGFMIEPASTNLLSDSGILDGILSFSTRSSVGLTPVDTLWNMGTFLDKGMKLDLSASIAYCYKGYTFTVGASYIFSFYVKLSDSALPTRSDFRINVQGDTLFLDHSSVSIEPMGNGVYLISAPFVGKASALYVGVAKYTNDSAKSFVVTGFQVEESTRKTSYIPTTTASATRLADKLVGNRPISVFQFNSWFIESDKFTGWFGNGVTGLKIAGRNYIKNSALFYPFSNNNTNVFTLNAGIENGVRWVSGIEKATGKFAVTTYSVLANGPEVTENLVNATDIVASVDLMSPANISVRFGTKTVNLVAGQWQRVFDTGLTVDRVPSIYALTNPEAPVDTKIYYKNYKLERGTVATAWNPAPEDFVKIAGNGTVEISSDFTVCIRSLSLVARQLKQSEV